MTLIRISRRSRRRPQVESLEGRTMLTAGALDTSFGGTGEVITQLSYNSYSQGLAVQADLKTVVVGLESPSDTTGVYPHSLFIVRYNENGSLDSTFGSGGEVVLATNTAKNAATLHNASVAIQPDGKIVIAANTATANSGGSFTSCNMLVLRLNTNGSLDTSFGKNGETVIQLPQGMAEAHGVSILSGGQIVVAGTNPNGYVGPEFVVARLTSSGALDTTFGPNGQGYDYTTVSSTGPFVSTVDALGVDAAGNLLVGGTWYNASSGVRSDQVVRYTSTGLIDTAFANQGVLDLPFGGLYGVEGIGFQSTGQIILGVASNSNNNGGIVRLNPNGTVDTTFGSSGYFSDPIETSYVDIAVQPDDKILLQTVSLNSAGYENTLVDRLLPGGTLDPAFGTGGREQQASNYDVLAEGIAVGPDGKITATQSTTITSPLGFGTFRLLDDAPVTGQLVVTQQPPSSTPAGNPFGLTIDVDDSSGNLESSYSGTVTVALASGPANATIGGTLTVTASGGIATFSGLTLTTAASGYTLVVSGSSLGDAVTSAITVSPLAASQLVIKQQPAASVTAGTAFGVQAAIEDMYGNVETGDNSDVVTVALASNPGGTTLGGTLTATMSQGVATFAGLTLKKADTGYTLGLSTGSHSATTSAVTVNPATATQLVITQEPPASVGLSAAFGMQASVEDAYGNLVTNAADTVKVALDNNPKGAKLGGTLSVKTSAGVATFSGLTLNKVGSGYTLEVTSNGLTAAVTSGITVTSSSPNAILGPPGGSGGSGALLAPLVTDSVEVPGNPWYSKHKRSN